MSLRLKINLIVGLLAALFVAVVLALHLRNLRDAVSEEVVAANRVAVQMLQRTVRLYTSQGTAGMLGFLQGVGRVRANDIRMVDVDGRELYVSPPSTYKAGRDAPAWFAALIAPQVKSELIAFPGGHIEAAPNASRAVLDAWDNIVRFAGIAVALLACVVALVTWLVGRAVRPFGAIVRAIGDVQAGRFDTSLPALPGREAGTIAQAFNRMVVQLRDHIETEKRAVRAETKLHDSRELARWVDRHVEEERRLIARELHDEFGQSVTAMRSMALAVAQGAKARADADTARTATLIADEAMRLYDAMHGVIPRLAPLVLDRFGLAEALDDLARRTRAAHPALELVVQHDLEGAALDPDTALALYRGAQEGLTNAIQHGQATRVTITLGQDPATAPPGIRLEVDDNGRGLPSEGARRAGHYGLRWLADRAEALGGSLEITSHAPAREAGTGARLLLRLPASDPGTATGATTDTSTGTGTVTGAVAGAGAAPALANAVAAPGARA
jgi:two-component system sensor histidine kinase UhpB